MSYQRRGVGLLPPRRGFLFGNRILSNRRQPPPTIKPLLRMLPEPRLASGQIQRGRATSAVPARPPAASLPVHTFNYDRECVGQTEEVLAGESPVPSKP
jgi:hypothetical protein